MEKSGQSYSSAEWLVQAGSEDDFIERWNTFIEWSLNNAPGAKSFVLVRCTEDPRRFLSLGAWENQDAQERWREMPQMQELLGQCRELCEEFESHSYTLAASPSTGPVSGVTDTVGDTVGGVTGTVGGATDSVRGVTDNLLGGEEKQR